MGHWLQGVDAVIQLLPSDAKIQDADKENAQTMLANIMLGLIEEPGGEPRAQGVGSGERAEELDRHQGRREGRVRQERRGPFHGRVADAAHDEAPTQRPSAGPHHGVAQRLHQRVPGGRTAG